MGLAHLNPRMLFGSCRNIKLFIVTFLRRIRKTIWEKLKVQRRRWQKCVSIVELKDAVLQNVPTHAIRQRLTSARKNSTKCLGRAHPEDQISDFLRREMAMRKTNDSRILNRVVFRKSCGKR